MNPERVLPHNLEAERAVLGSCLLDPKAWAVASSVITAQAFFRDAHRRLFEAMEALVARGAAMDYITLKDELGRRGDLEEIGGPAYITGLIDGLPRSTNVEHYAGIVRETSSLRSLIYAANQAANAAYAGDQPAARVATDALAAISTAVAGAGAGVETIGQAATKYASDLVSGALANATPFGYADLDALTGGFRPGDLVIVAARPSVGKSSFILGTAASIAQSGRRVLFFPMETGARALTAQLVSWRVGVSSATLERGLVSDQDYVLASEVILGLADVPLLIEEQARTVAEVGAWCERLHREAPLACAIVDYMQLMRGGQRRGYASESAEMAAISNGIRQIARTVGIPIIALSQLSRELEKRRDKRPHLADLRGSGALEQDADMAVLLFREEMYKPKPENLGIAEAIVAKNRTGPVGVVRLQFDKHVARFRDLALQDG